MSFHTMELIALMLLPEGRDDQDRRNARASLWHRIIVIKQWASCTGDIISGKMSQSRPVLSHR